jgi:ribonuclease HIII
VQLSRNDSCQDAGLSVTVLAMANRTSYTFKLSAEQQVVLAGILQTGNYRLYPMEHTKIAASLPNCKICLYKSGKLLVQGKGSEEFVTFVLEPIVLQEAQLGYEDVHAPDRDQPHMGIDESGKGDFFGPLVTASVYVDKTLAAKMREMDVRDSKDISSDKKALELSHALKRLLGRRYSVVAMGPESYNRLYSKMRNVNKMLSWAHARVIENLLEAVPDCPLAISDQFGSKQQVERALMKKGRDIELVQRHRAESDIAVAAASVIARGEFLRALLALEKKYEQPFPKGASAGTREAAVDLINTHDATILLKTAKCHFKTADNVLSELNLKREVLGELGAATSKATSFRRSKPKRDA